MVLKITLKISYNVWYSELNGDKLEGLLIEIFQVMKMIVGAMETEEE